MLLIDWTKFAPALLLLLVPIGLFHGPKVRFRSISREWTDHWHQILALGLHWIDFGRAIIGAWWLNEALTLQGGATGVARYYVLIAQAVVLLVAVALQACVCREEDSANAPFLFVSGIVIGFYPPIIAGFPLILAATVILGLRTPTAYFPVLAIFLTGIGFAFDRRILTKLLIGACAIALPWLFSLLFNRDLVVSYRAKRASKKDSSKELV